MNEAQHPALRFADRFKDLAEGRVEPADWIAWWQAHAREVEAACPRGWFLRLKTSVDRNGFGINDVTWSCQEGAIYVLLALNVPFTRSDRYKAAREDEVQRFLADAKSRKAARAKQLTPRLAALAEIFPKFARFLKKHADDIDELDDPATEQEVEAVENSLGIPLPATCKQFLRCTKSLRLDGFAIGLAQIFRHPAVIHSGGAESPTICVADYWLESDGDQVLCPYASSPSEDPPAYYYAHSAGTNTARELAPSFSTWIESLPRSPVFKR